MVLYAGYSGSSGAKRDVWSLALGDSVYWTELAPNGTKPDGRYRHTAVLDTRRDEMVAYGGYPPGKGRRPGRSASRAHRPGPVWMPAPRSQRRGGGTPPSGTPSGTASS